MIEIFNNQWIVGLGVTVIGGLVLYYVFGIGKKEEPSKVSKKSLDKKVARIHNSVLTAGGDILVASSVYKNDDVKKKKRIKIIDPETIVENIRKSKPFLVDQVTESYKGIRVKWKLKFLYIKNISEDMWRITANSNKGFEMIMFKINLDEHPEFKSMDKGEEFQVEGVIKEIDYIKIIHLDDCEVF
jgi:hypothetical protein